MTMHDEIMEMLRKGKTEEEIAATYTKQMNGAFTAYKAEVAAAAAAAEEKEKASKIRIAAAQSVLAAIQNYYKSVHPKAVSMKDITAEQVATILDGEVVIKDFTKNLNKDFDKTMAQFLRSMGL